MFGLESGIFPPQVSLFKTLKERSGFSSFNEACKDIIQKPAARASSLGIDLGPLTWGEDTQNMQAATQLAFRTLVEATTKYAEDLEQYRKVNIERQTKSSTTNYDTNSRSIL